MTDTQTTVAITKLGCEWGEIVNEIEWLQEEQGDLSEAMMSIEDQLPVEYWDSEAEFTVSVPAYVAKLVARVETTDE